MKVATIFVSRVHTLYKFIIDFEFSKFRVKKLQMVKVFGRELRLRHYTNESFSKWGNKSYICQ